MVISQSNAGMLKYSRAPGLDMKVFSLPCWSNRVQTHTHSCDGCVWIQRMSGAHSSFRLAPAGSLGYAGKNHEVWSDVIRLPSCQQRDHVCTILMSVPLKPCKNLPFIQFWSRCKPAPVDDSNESLPDLFHLNTFIYKWVQVWVIGILFSKQKNNSVHIFNGFAPFAHHDRRGNSWEPSNSPLPSTIPTRGLSRTPPWSLLVSCRTSSWRLPAAWMCWACRKWGCQRQRSPRPRYASSQSPGLEKKKKK